jgi:hypothetical protein
VAAHLDDCRDCRAVYDGLGQTRNLFFRRNPPTVDERFVFNVMAAIKSLDESKKPWSFFDFLNRHQWYYPVLATAALAGFLFIMLTPLKESAVTVETILMENKMENLPNALVEWNGNQSNEQPVNILTEEL